MIDSGNRIIIHVEIELRKKERTILIFDDNDDNLYLRCIVCNVYKTNYSAKVDTIINLSDKSILI